MLAPLFPRRRRAALVAAVVLAVTSPALAGETTPSPQPDTDDMVWVPLDLIVHGQGDIVDLSLVALGCNSTDGTHAFTITTPSQPMRCGEKSGPVALYAVPTQDVKPFQDLKAKEKGIEKETAEVKKLLGTRMWCGEVKDKLHLPKSKNITNLTAHYQITRTAKDCTLKQIGETMSQNYVPPTPPPPPEPVATAPQPAATTSSAATPASSMPEKAGCGCGCLVSPSPRTDALAFAAFAGAVAGAALRRRRREPPRTSA